MTPGDERFARSMADLSSRLRERMARQPPTDPITALKNRQAALKAFDRDRRQKLYVIAGGVGCVVAAGALAWGIVMFAQSDQAATAIPNKVATVTPVTPPAATPSPPPAKLASATPPAQTPPPIAPVTVEATTVPAPDRGQVPGSVDAKPVKQTAAAAEDPRPAESRPAEPRPADRPPAAAQLPPNQIAEAQRLLAAFGFSPGPIDGTAGPRTVDAVSRYQKERGLTQTGVLDSDLLQQLRQDPSPKTVMVAQRAPNSTYSQRPYAPSRQSNAGVFEPVRMAGQQITAWLNSVFR